LFFVAAAASQAALMVIDNCLGIIKAATGKFKNKNLPERTNAGYAVSASS